ncbi:hypothetical protein HDU84_008919 [Entophlyctis sp. JEL0112]|nr:hypothetical protein HDU84_008919 [Entophlyctis sp. JEL0112]
MGSAGGFLVATNTQHVNAPVPERATSPQDFAALPAAMSAVPIEDVPEVPSGVRVRLSRKQFILVFFGLLLGIMMAALDQTIVSTALKSIIADLGHQELVPWIGSAYLLTAAPFGTLYGKFTDLFGRKWVFVFALVMFEVGSLICGLAPSMNALIIGRAIAGIGGGGIFSCVLIIISDVVSLVDRGKYQGIIGACFGLSSVIGPLLGGAFSDGITWRWCFYINLPLGALTVATVVIFLKFPLPDGTFSEKVKRIDFFGTAALFVTILVIVTPLQLGGSVWSWNAPQAIALLVLFPLLFGLFGLVELKIAKEAIVPASLFCNSSVPALLVVAFSVGASFFSAVYYISLFFQVVNGNTATQAGIQTIPLVFGVVILSVASGIIVSKTGIFLRSSEISLFLLVGNYRFFLVIGPIFAIAGLGVTSSLNSTSFEVQKVFYLLILGMGCGCMIQTRVLGIQASVPRELIAIATAVSQTCMTLGGAFGISVSGAVFNNIISSGVSGYSSLSSAIAQLEEHGIDVNPSEVTALSQLLLNVPFLTNGSAANEDLINLFTNAFNIAYLSLIVYPAMILVAVVFLKHVGFPTKPTDGP